MISVRLLVAGIAAMIALPQSADSQGVGISAVAVAAGHELLGDRLVGGAAHLSIARRGWPVSARVSVERMTGTGRRTGCPCAGFLREPRPDEPIRDDARLTTIAGGLGLRLWPGRRLAVEITGDLRRGWVKVDTRGLTSGGRLSADKRLKGIDMGIEAAWSPWARLPLSLVGGVSSGRLKPLVSQPLIDGYSPFESDFHFTRLRVGVAWRPSAR